MVEPVGWFLTAIEGLFLPAYSSRWRKGAPDTVSKATRYAEWYKQENPNRSPHIDQLFDAVIETRERQAAGEKAERATERLLDAAFKELDRHAASGKPSPRAENLATAALLALMGGGKGAPDTVSKATRYAEWYKQENPNRSPHIDQLFDAVIETRERQAAGETAERATERLLDAAFKELDRHLVSREPSPVVEEFVAAALVILNRNILPDKDKEEISD